jgi:hypothetical protein
MFMKKYLLFVSEMPIFLGFVFGFIMLLLLILIALIANPNQNTTNIIAVGFIISLLFPFVQYLVVKLTIVRASDYHAQVLARIKNREVVEFGTSLYGKKHICAITIPEIHFGFMDLSYVNTYLVKNIYIQVSYDIRFKIVTETTDYHRFKGINLQEAYENALISNRISIDDYLRRYLYREIFNHPQVLATLENTRSIFRLKQNLNTVISQIHPATIALSHFSLIHVKVTSIRIADNN